MHYFARSITNLRGIRLYIIMLIMGMASSLSLPPYFLVIFNFIAFPILYYYTTRSANKKTAFLIGWWFGLGHFTVGLYWFAHALLIEADKFAWLIPFANLGLPAILAIYIGLSTYCFHIIINYAPNMKMLSELLVWASIWTIFEWLRGHLFTGFPWNLIGYSWANSPEMLQVTSVLGIYGLSFITILLVSAPAILFEYKKNILLLIFISSLGLANYYMGAQRLALHTTEYTDTSLRIVQANIPQNVKWQNQALFNNMMRHLQLSNQESRPDKMQYIIWPESAVPYPINNSKLLELLASVIPKKGLLLTGSIRVAGQTTDQKKWWNSLTAINSAGEITGYYDKTHLVPFGEYIPFRSILPMEKIAYGMSDWERGTGPITDKFSNQLPAVSPLICYEIIFPHEVTDNKHQAKWLLNVTNDGWYGNSFGPYQHFYMALVRTVEEGIPLVRAANTGISAVIDSYGRIVKYLPLQSEGVIDSFLPAPASSKTLYPNYGDVTMMLLILVIALYIKLFD